MDNSNPVRVDNLFGPMPDFAQRLSQLTPYTDSDRAEIDRGAYEERIEHLEQQLRDCKYYLRASNKGAERASHFAKACHMEARVLRGENDRLKQFVREATHNSRHVDPVLQILSDAIRLRASGAAVDVNFVLDQVERVLNGDARTEF